jgi:hypothetical protein
MTKTVRLIKPFEPTIYDEPRVKLLLECGHKAVAHLDCEVEVGDNYRCDTCSRIRVN